MKVPYSATKLTKGIYHDCSYFVTQSQAVVRIRIRKFLGLLDPDPNPSINKQNKVILISTLLWLLNELLTLKTDVNVLTVSNKPCWHLLATKEISKSRICNPVVPYGSGSSGSKSVSVSKHHGSVSRHHGSVPVSKHHGCVSKHHRSISKHHGSGSKHHGSGTLVTGKYLYLCWWLAWGRDFSKLTPPCNSRVVTQFFYELFIPSKTYQ